MAVSTEVVALRYIDVAAGVPISVGIPTFEASDISVVYGNAALVAVQGTDYTVALDEENFSTITVTPTAALIAKIDALIAFDSTETNYIVVRRALNFTTEVTPDGARYTPFTSREFERTVMRFQQQQDVLDRSLRLSDKFAKPFPSLTIAAVEEGKALAWGPDGTIVNIPSGEADVAAAVADALQYRNETEAAKTATLAAQSSAEAAETGAVAAQSGAEAAETGAVAAQAAAETARDAAVTARTAAEAAETGAESARDAAVINSGAMYADVAAGEAATSAGDYFTVPSSADDGYVDLYLNVAGTGTYQDTYPNATLVRQPSRTGKLNGWLDPFFRRTVVGADLLGKARWYRQLEAHPYRWTLSDNPMFDGNALRKSELGSGSDYLTGPRIHLDDIGATVGDTITIRALIVGDGAYCVFAGRPLNSAGSIIDVQKNGVDDAGVGGAKLTSGTPLRMTITFTVPSDMASFWLYPYLSNFGAGSYWEITALWAYKGAPASGPAWPDFSGDPYLQAALSEAESGDSLATRVSREENVTDYMFQRYDDVTGDSESVAQDVTNPQVSTAYGQAFGISGWGEPYTPNGLTFNAVQVPYIGRKNDVDEANFWRTVEVVVRTGANSHQSGATLVAVGSTRVLPDVNPLTDVTVLLRDPTTGEVVTLTDSDFSGGQYFIGVSVKNADGARSYSSPHLGTVANPLGTPASYYITSGDPETATWLLNTGNPRLGVRHLLITNPVTTEVYEPTGAFLASLDVQAADRPAVANTERLTNLAARVAKGEALSIGLFGDSWTQTAFRIHTPLSEYINTAIGVSAQGYTSLNSSLPPVAGVTRSRTGTWIDVRYPTEHVAYPGGGYGPEGAHAITLDPTATVSFTRTDGAVSRYRIHYVRQTNGGSFRYSTGGAPVTIDTSGATTYGTVDVVSSAALLIEIVSAGADGVLLCGVEVLNETAGEAVLHKLGNGGADTGRYVTIPQAYFQAAVSAMALDVAILSLGTNDHSYSTPPSTFAAEMGQIAARVRAARPLCDIFIVGAGPNGATGLPYTIKLLNDALYDLCAENKYTFLDLEPFFGTYADANSRGLYSDIYHPNTEGGLVIGRAIWNWVLKDYME